MNQIQSQFCTNQVHFADRLWLFIKIEEAGDIPDELSELYEEGGEGNHSERNINR